MPFSNKSEPDAVNDFSYRSYLEGEKRVKDHGSNLLGILKLDVHLTGSSLREISYSILFCRKEISAFCLIPFMPKCVICFRGALHYTYWLFKGSHALSLRTQNLNVSLELKSVFRSCVSLPSTISQDTAYTSTAPIAHIQQGARKILVTEK